MAFSKGSYVEVLLDSQWFLAIVDDQDDGDKEILVRYLETNKNTEWVSYASSNVRPAEKPASHVISKPPEPPKPKLEITVPSVKPEIKENTCPIQPIKINLKNIPEVEKCTSPSQESVPSKFKIGDCVTAAWSKSKNFPARIEAVLPNEEYRVQFEDGLKKIVSESQLTKEADIVPDPSYPKYSTRHKSIDFNALQNVEEVVHKKKKKKKDKHKSIRFSFEKHASSVEPRTGCEIITQAEVHKDPELISDQDFTQPLYFQRKDGTGSYSIPMEDSKLPPGWCKHKLYSNNRWQAVIVNSENKKFFGRQSLIKYFKSRNLHFPSEKFDFSYMEGGTQRRKKSLDNPEKKVKVLSPVVSTPKTPIVPVQNPEFNLTPSSDGNYICPQEDCAKKFRKENLLIMHLKFYHPEYKSMLPDTPNVAEMAYARTSSMDETAEEPVKQPRKRDSGSSELPHLMTTPVKPAPLPPPPVPQIIKSKKDSPVKVADSLPSHAKDEEKPSVCQDALVDFEDQIAHFEISKKSVEVKDKVESSPITPEKKDPVKTNFTSPPSVKYEKMKKEEVVNCVCGVLEEDGLMIQCDICLCWQHGMCADIESENDVPDKYICNICKNPPLQRRSQMYSYDHDWLSKGSLKTLDPNKQYNEGYMKMQSILAMSHSVTGHLCKIGDSVHNAKVKMQVVKDPNHPKLYLWSKSVKAEDSDIKQETCNVPMPETPINTDECRLNLLAEVNKDYDLIDKKLDELESQLSVLESDSAGLMGNPLNDKPTVQMLLRDLEALRTLAIVN